MGKVSVGNLGFLAVAARFLSDFVLSPLLFCFSIPPPLFFFFVCFIALAPLFIFLPSPVCSRAC